MLFVRKPRERPRWHFHCAQEVSAGDAPLGKGEVWDPTDWSDAADTCFACFVLHEGHPSLQPSKVHAMRKRGKASEALQRQHAMATANNWNRYTPPGHAVKDSTVIVQRTERVLNIYNETEFQEAKGCTLADANLKANFRIQNEEGEEELVCAIRPPDSRKVRIEAWQVLSLDRNRMPFEVSRTQADEVFSTILQQKLAGRSFVLNDSHKWPTEAWVNSRVDGIIAERQARETDGPGDLAGAPRCGDDGEDDDDAEVDLVPKLTSATDEIHAGQRRPKAPPRGGAGKRASTQTAKPNKIQRTAPRQPPASASVVQPPARQQRGDAQAAPSHTGGQKPAQCPQQWNSKAEWDALSTAGIALPKTFCSRTGQSLGSRAGGSQDGRTRGPASALGCPEGDDGLLNRNKNR